MGVRGIFVFQFCWFLLAWSTVVATVVAPRLRGWSRDDRLAAWISPQAFRVLGAGLLVPSLAPGMPRSFALPTAIGDSLTALLAILALVALHRRRPLAVPLAWSCTVVGLVDAVVAVLHAAAIDASNHLAAQWFVPVAVLPLMLVCHVMAIRTLLDRTRSS